ncbi:MAG: hypothetical protein U5K69_27325 [Balneolaceae bacterium]|nr:hypothetical protein [Balneolaceae bacterium]
MVKLILILSLLVATQADTADTTATVSGDRTSVSVIRIEGAISPTTTNYINRGIAQARESGAECLLIEMDTPGGLLESTKNIVQTFFDSDLPIVVYVSPDGARAASAGTFITMAAHIAAMAPSTTHRGGFSRVNVTGRRKCTDGYSHAEENLQLLREFYREHR